MNNKNYRFARWTIWGQQFQARVLPHVFWLATPLLWLRRTVKPQKVTLGIFAGQTGELPLKILCGVNDQQQKLWLRLAFSETSQRTALGRWPLKKLFQRHARLAQDCSLVVTDIKKQHFEWLDRGDWFYLPLWVAGKIPLPLPEKTLRSNSIKRDLRTIRQHGLAYEITKDEAAFQDFFHNLHLPYVTRAYGAEACLDSYGDKRAQFEQCDLLLIKQPSKTELPVAGVLIIYEPAGPRLWSLGVREGYFNNGITPALYHFAFQHLAARGFDHVNVGGSRAFLRDGVLRFKRKMAQTIFGCSWQGMALKILAFTPGTQTFLVNNPFIFQRHELLYGACFVTAVPTLETIADLHHELFCPGLVKLIIYHFAEGETTTRDPLPPELAGQVEIRPAATLLRPAS